MNDTLKAAGRIGAELGAAKAENEKLREALRPFAAFEAVRSKQGGCTPKSGTVWAVASISEEAEITVEHLQAAVAAVDMATAAAQWLRDGQAAVEQAPAQDEREAFEAWVRSENAAGCVADMKRGWMARAASPAQTEQPEQSEELAWKVLQAATDALDRRAAPHAWISQAWNAGSEVITSRRAAKPTQGASEQ